MTHLHNSELMFSRCFQTPPSSHLGVCVLYLHLLLTPHIDPMILVFQVSDCGDVVDQSLQQK